MTRRTQPYRATPARHPGPVLDMMRQGKGQTPNPQDLARRQQRIAALLARWFRGR